MLQQDRISEFIYTLITYAKDEDIETFLEYSFESSASLYEIYKEEEKKLKYITSKDRHKILLIQYLFDHAYSYIETEIPDIIDIIKPKNDYINVCNDRKRGWYDPLYMNLYALCLCYYSHIMYDPVLNHATKFVVGLYSKEKNIPEPKISDIKDGSKTKLLHLLITSAKINKFYYLFREDKLLKIKIRKKSERKISKFISDDFNKQGLIYSITEYRLVDENNQTYIVNEDENIKESLGRILVQLKDFNKNKKLEDRFKYIEIPDFATIKANHNKIVSVLSRRNTSEKYIKNEYDKLVEKSSKLFDKLAILQDAIPNEEPNKYILKFKKINFKEELLLLQDCTSRSTKEIKRNAKKDLEDYINELKKNIEKENDEFVYGNISKLIKETELLISEILDD